MIHKMACFKVRKKDVETVQRAIVECIEAVKKNEPFTLLYESFVESDHQTFVHVMSFEDAEAEEKHKSSAYVKKFVKILYPLCEEEPVFTELKMIKSNKRKY